MRIQNDVLDDFLASELDQLNLLFVLGIYATLPEFWNRKTFCEKPLLLMFKEKKQEFKL